MFAFNVLEKSNGGALEVIFTCIAQVSWSCSLGNTEWQLIIFRKEATS